MCIDDLIEKLQVFRNEYGNVEVYNMATGCDVSMVDTTEDADDDKIGIIII